MKVEGEMMEKQTDRRGEKGKRRKGRYSFSPFLLFSFSLLQQYDLMCAATKRGLL
jgi:hypothetical protein